MDVFIIAERMSYSSTGWAYRAFRADGTPLYVGGETVYDVRSLVEIFWPHAIMHGPIPLA